MTLELNDQEQQDLQNLIYAKMKELDADPESEVENSRKFNLVNRLEAIYERIRQQ